MHYRAKESERERGREREREKGKKKQVSVAALSHPFVLGQGNHRNECGESSWDTVGRPGREATCATCILMGCKNGSLHFRVAHCRDPDKSGACYRFACGKASRFR